MNPSLCIGTPAFYTTDGVEGIYQAVPRADVQDTLVHQRRAIDGISRLDAPTDNPIGSLDGQHPTITQANVEQVSRQGGGGVKRPQFLHLPDNPASAAMQTGQPSLGISNIQTIASGNRRGDEAGPTDKLPLHLAAR